MTIHTDEFILPTLEDVESNWFYSEGMDRIQVYAHKDYKDLLRVMDFETKRIIFSDRKRIDKVVDVNEAVYISEPRMAVINFLLYRVIDAEKPITMPYKPEKLKLYIEDLGKFVGVLYYMDANDDKDLVRINRYFKQDVGIMFKEVTYEEYRRYYEEEFDYVDTGSDESDSSKLS